MKAVSRLTRLEGWARRPLLVLTVTLMVAAAAFTGLLAGPLRGRTSRRPLRVKDLAAKSLGGAHSISKLSASSTGSSRAGSSADAGGTAAAGAGAGGTAAGGTGAGLAGSRTHSSVPRAKITVLKRGGHRRQATSGAGQHVTTRPSHLPAGTLTPGQREISRHFEPGYGPILTPAEQLSLLKDVPSGWSKTWHTLRVGALSRHYIMVRPPATAGKIPVLLVLHGRWADPAIIERVSHFTSVVGKAILVYPAGYLDSWDAGGCCGRAYRAGVNDVGFISDVVHQVLATQRDAGRVYLSGFSNGGRLAYRVVCDRPGMFAGFAAVEAVPVLGCTPSRPVPAEIVARTGDPFLTVAQGATPKVIEGSVEPTVEKVVARWRAIDGCSAVAKVVRHGIATITTWTHCRAGARVQFCLYRAIGHLWTPASGATPSAQSVVWDFLRHRPVSVPV